MGAEEFYYSMTEDHLKLAEQFVTGKSLGRKDTIEMVRALLGALKTQAPAPARELPPCPVSVTKLHDSALLLGQDANRAYNKSEALALAAKIAGVAGELK